MLLNAGCFITAAACGGGLLLLAYLAGSAPSGKLLARWGSGLDITKMGSGNIGATNVLRQAGPALGLATLACDAGKGALPVLLTHWVFNDLPGAEPWAALAALSAFFGHLYPVYSRFKQGGKGVATAAGAILVLSPAALGAALAVFAVGVGASRRASVGSLAASFSLPLFLFGFSNHTAYGLAGVVMAVFVWVRHKENIRRLLNREEPPLF